MKGTKLFKKSLVYALVGSMLVSSVTPALAYEHLDKVDYDENNNSIAEIHEEVEVTEAGNSEVSVYAELGSEFLVKIPKALTLSGTEKKGAYTVSVEGDISGTETIKVVPDETFALSSSGLADVTANITQDKTQWSYNEILENEDKVIGNGAIDASGISAGEWKGVFWFNIKLDESKVNSGITVTSKDKDGNDLNASASEITGTEKDELLNSLVDTGLINSTDEVNALIEVESDEFEGMADTTFDVSSIAKEGDKVTILHFDEEKQEWEYIGTETVDENGLISGDFSSYSPVAFVKVNEDGEQEIINKKLILKSHEKLLSAGSITQTFLYLGDERITDEITYSCDNKNVTVDKLGYVRVNSVLEPGTIVTVIAEYAGETASVQFEAVEINVYMNGEKLNTTVDSYGTTVHLQCHGYETFTFEVEVIGSQKYDIIYDGHIATDYNFFLYYVENNTITLQANMMSSPNYDFNTHTYNSNYVSTELFFRDGGSLNFAFNIIQ